MKCCRRSISIFGVVAMLASVVSCHAGAEDTRSQLQDRRTEWDRQVKSLTQRCDATLNRLRDAPEKAADLKVGARRAQLDAIVQGTRQSLQDLTVSIGQRSRDIDVLIGRSPEGAAVALEQENARVVELLRMLGKQLETAEADLTRVGRR